VFAAREGWFIDELTEHGQDHQFDPNEPTPGCRWKLLWNDLMPELFGLSSITFWQALELSVLCSILFQSHSSK
jgi:hypothetical protein